MRILISLSFLLVFLDDSSTYIKGKGFEGYIFDKTHLVMISISDQKSRYTPTKPDIERAECLVRMQLKLINKSRINQASNCPIINKKLAKYKRQYVGFINDKGEKIIWTNFLWSKNIPEQMFSNDIINVQDGCSYFWNVKINLSSEQVFDLDINGEA